MFKIHLQKKGLEHQDWTFREVNLMTELGQQIAYKFVRENPDYVIMEYDNDIKYDVAPDEDLDVLMAIADVLKEKNINSLDELYHDIQVKDFSLTYAVNLNGLTERKGLIFNRWIAENL